MAWGSDDVPGVELELPTRLGFAASVLSAADATKLTRFRYWPRMVTLLNRVDPVPVVRAWLEAGDPAGDVRVELGTDTDARQVTLFGASVVAVSGPLPAGTCRAIPPGREVLLLGGPRDGDVLRTEALDVVATGVWDDFAQEWRDVSSGDGGTPVHYRVRRAAEVAESYAGPLDDREWVATFEGEWPGDAPAEPERGERAELLHLLEVAVLGVGGYSAPRIAEACADALLARDEHAQPGGEADPDDVLLAVVGALDGVIVADAASLCEQALAVTRALDEQFTIHPREQA